MTQRRYGPTLDAGTVIIEKDSEKQIQPSMLGVTAYVGILEKGDPSKLITATSKKDMLRKVGGYIPDSMVPDAAMDFWDHGNGAGLLLLKRVTDGNEAQASLVSYDRKTPKNKVVTWKAKSGGTWGGKRRAQVVDLTTVPTDITNTTITLPMGYIVKKNQFKGGTLTLTGASKTYKIVSNTAGTDSTRAVITLAADSKALTDFGGGSDKEVILEVPQSDTWGRLRCLAVEIMDGQVNPSTEWGCKIYEHGVLAKIYPDLSSDPLASNYFVKVINEDTSNEYVTVVDEWVGAVTADTRPANFYASVDSAKISEKQIDLDQVLAIVDASGAGSNTIGTYTWGARAVKDAYTLTYVLADTKWSVVSADKQAGHTFPQVTGATPYVADNALSFGFTITESTPLNNQHFHLTILPLVEDEAIGGRIFFYDQSFAPGQGWIISDNAEDTIDISSGDLTNGGTLTGNVKVRLQYPQQLECGLSGNEALTEAQFIAAYDTGASLFNQVKGKGYGLVKHGTPGVTNISGVNSVLVQKAGAAYAEAKDHQFRYEIPQAYVDEVAVRDYVQGTLGKSDFVKVCMHGWVKVSDPILVSDGIMKTIPSIGMIHGREALIAKNYGGYHKVAAGMEVTFPRIRELLTGDAVINGEVVNPAGIQRIDMRGGNFVLWGAKIPSIDPAYRFCQHRELMSHYELTLIDSYDYIIFAINDEVEQPGLIASLQSLFYPEWTKRAIRGATFTDACKIKIDEENNTDATRAAGDLNADIVLRLADTVERFIISISKAGVYESAAA